MNFLILPMSAVVKTMADEKKMFSCKHEYRLFFIYWKKGFRRKNTIEIL